MTSNRLGGSLAPPSRGFSGDYIRLGSGEDGYVTDVPWRSTILQALANNLILVPNTKLSQAIVTNYHLPEKKMSLLIPIGVSYGSDPDQVEKILVEEALQGSQVVPGLLSDPAPFVRFIPGFGDSSLNFTLICQVSEYVDQYLAQHELRKRIFQRFRKEKIEIPFPCRTLYLEVMAKDKNCRLLRSSALRKDPNMPTLEPFRFYTERRLVALTGLRAGNLVQLLEHLANVPGSSIFYHTHHQFLSQHYQKSIFFNDFALWTSEALQEERLSERLAAIDLLAFTTIRDLRNTIISTIEGYLRERNWQLRECPAGDEFHFCRSKSFIMPTGIEALDIPDFFLKIPLITSLSLFFHFFEARLRLERPTNDFSQWLMAREEHKLAQAIDRLDPYSMTMNELKEQIISLNPYKSRLAS
jgi:hypothetical protein